MLRSRQRLRVCQPVSANPRVPLCRKGLRFHSKLPIPAMYVPSESLNQCVLVAFDLKDLDGLV